MKLKKVWQKEIRPAAPFNFDRTVHNPSYFPTQTEDWKPGTYWYVARYGGKLLGLKLESKGTIARPKVKLTVYAREKLSEKFKKKLVEDVGVGFGFDEDLSGFYKKFKSDRFLGPVLKRAAGQRVPSEDLYVLLMISIVLQNATARRSTQMMAALLKKYGTLLEFDGKKLYVFWKPEKLAKASERELRKLKVGYRAKMFVRVSKQFASGEINAEKIRKLGWREARKELLKIYGVGPVTANILLWEWFRAYELEPIFPPWERKIMSRLMFKKEMVSEKRLIAEFKKRYEKWAMLAFHLIFTDLFWRREKGERIPWLEKEIRL